MARGVKRNTQMRAVLASACLTAGLAVVEFFCLLQEMRKQEVRSLETLQYGESTTLLIMLLRLLDLGQQIYSHDVCQDLFHCVHLRVQAVAESAVHGHTVGNDNRDKVNSLLR